MNGTYDNYILMGPKDDIYVTFTKEYDYVEVTNNCLKTVFDIYSKNYRSKNIIIDDRLILQICYLGFYYNDLLIYNTKTTKIETFNQHVSSRYLKGRFVIPSRLKMILFIYVFTDKICKYKPIQWNLDSAMLATRNLCYLPQSINLVALVKYFEHLRIYNPRFQNKYDLNIQNYISIGNYDCLFPPEFETQNIIYNIINLSKRQKFLII